MLQKLIFPAILCGLVLVAGSVAMAQDIEQLEEDAVAKAVARIDASVIQLETIGGVDRVGDAAASVGPFTATVVHEDGFLVASSFSFIHKPASIFARLPGGDRAACKIVARDHSRNLLILKVDTEKKLAVPKFRSRSDLEVGGWAIAVGRVFDPAATNISTGIISATNRIWGKAVQTDAKISPNNFGGPLVDIEGNVIGILTPLSTRGETVTAGVDWYDSGIGFAVPLEDLLPRLDQLKKGNDLFPGRIGVSFKGKNVYADPAEIAALGGTSPAAKAGIRVGDVIVELAGRKVRRQSELRHAIGPWYAGDKVKVSVDRDGERLEFEVTLAKTIEPFVQPYLGLLFESADELAELRVRHVFKESPAAKAGVQIGDTLVQVGEKEITDRDGLQAAMLDLKVGTPSMFGFRRGGNLETLQLTIVKAEANLPANLAAAKNVDRELEYETGKVEVKVPEEPNACHAWIPEKAFASAPGLMVWLSNPGEIDFDAQSKNWQAFCNERNFILMMPQSADKTKWLPDDAEFVQKAIDQLQLSHRIDANRVVVGGVSSGGSMAAIAAFSNRETYRGLILVNAALPTRVGRITADPVNRLQVMIGSYTDLEKDTTAKTNASRFNAAKIPQFSVQMTPADLREKAAVWLDAVDRF